MRAVIAKKESMICVLKEDLEEADRSCNKMRCEAMNIISSAQGIPILGSGGGGDAFPVR